MANTTKHTEPCTELELVKKDMEYLTKSITKIEDHQKEQDDDRSDIRHNLDGAKDDVSNVTKDVSEIKTVNAFLAKEVKEIMDVKKKINLVILKYVSKFIFIILSMGSIVLLIKYGPLILKLLK